MGHQWQCSTCQTTGEAYTQIIVEKVFGAWVPVRHEICPACGASLHAEQVDFAELDRDQWVMYVNTAADGTRRIGYSRLASFR